ncbi:hypothetical protein K435DRAFT_870102 [Dendrothele bispora CBS 962.96]|uniref:Uncharacterized protein n=1 Tax=Dendrothele bispora (strain CBS 962.96) TaxID=1314807 RepID=A0A4S8L8S2_DENBC|nr:hypothetical protein K435DRAFT_870102 [Dendrothele bispora CBS 962.96]
MTTITIDPSLWGRDYVPELVGSLERAIPPEPVIPKASTASLVLPHGFVEDEVQAVKPPTDLFEYRDTDKDYDCFHDTELEFPPELIPAPPLSPPPFFSYPQSPTWTLRKSSQLLGGCYYSASAPIDLPSKLLEKSRMNTITTPPQILPVWDSEKLLYSFPEVPGMVKMIPGAVFCVDLNGTDDCPLFVGSVQTKESLSRYGTVGNKAVELLEKLQKLAWGDPKTKTPPIYAIEGLRQNDRSKAGPSGDCLYTGSMSLASMVEKGHGTGKVVPALQPTHEIGISLNFARNFTCPRQTPSIDLKDLSTQTGV